MLEDDNVIFVDFGDLFDPLIFGEEMACPDEESLLRYLEEGEEAVPAREGAPSHETQQQSGPLTKKKRGPQPKIMTREQFYKIRPKIPKISKVDQRRMYAAHFAEAYNSCDFDMIWDFISRHSDPEVRFVHRWVGSEEYFNFPRALEIQGWENIAEYWYGRCLVAPDLVVELKETKLYVRSDGYSTVVGSINLHCTRLYDGLISDSLIVQAAASRSRVKTVNELNNRGSDSPYKIDSDIASSDDTTVEVIADRVEETFDCILRNSELPVTKKGSKRKWTETANATVLTETDKKPLAIDVNPTPNTNNGLKKKVIPPGTGITLLTTVTMQLNKDQKVKHYEMTFALKQL